jgi:hypothetical protein
MPTSYFRNDFLPMLLALQQDGRQAISAPSNWADKPILEVPTEIDQIIDELSAQMLIGPNSNDTARWHFFVGSPGNGKSAAMGHLCRRLQRNKCLVVDEENVPISTLSSKPSFIPYAIQVYEQNKPYASAQIIQDASVVRNPFSAHVDPASELLETLQQAWDKGISLIVCTNRGVLEKAHSAKHMDNDVNSTPWFKALVEVASTTTNSIHGASPAPRIFERKKAAFAKMKLTWSHLDNRSLLLSSDTFEQLVQKATSHMAWQLCDSCVNKHLCPFRANRDWLADDNARAGVLRLLKRAEVMSGQVVVFREALALISLLLSGCPKDYGTTHAHPCDWVRDNATRGNIFALAVRRIYMSLFASRSPLGLESVESLKQRQLTALGGLADLDGLTDQTSQALRHVIDSGHPSIDVGVTRLLGEGGVLPDLDACREPLPAEFYDKWDSDFEAALRDPQAPCFTAIEEACILAWKELEENLEQMSDHSVSEAHWALRRWSSNFLLHFGALIEGRSAWAAELDSFADLFQLLAKPHDQRNAEEKRAIAQLNSRLEALLNATSASGEPSSAIKLSQGVTLQGQWVTEKLKPKVAPNATSGSVSLVIQFTGGEGTIFGAPIYLWLTRNADGNLDLRCFPQELLTGVQDSRVRAASKGDYAFQKDEVQLKVYTARGEHFILSRYDGDVHVEHKYGSVSEDNE